VKDLKQQRLYSGISGGSAEGQKAILQLKGTKLECAWALTIPMCNCSKGAHALLQCGLPTKRGG
jgi:hypothetical protein